MPNYKITGLTAPLVAQKLLGSGGEYAMLFLILMAVMSTGSAEVIAVTSLLIYDVFQTYIKPFRPNLQPGQCLLCLKFVRKVDGMTRQDADLCECPSAQKCEECKVRPSTVNVTCDDCNKPFDCKTGFKVHMSCVND